MKIKHIQLRLVVMVDQFDVGKFTSNWARRGGEDNVNANDKTKKLVLIVECLI